MWRLYRLTEAASDTPAARDLRAASCAFARSIVEHAGAGHWSAPTAPARAGGMELWFNLPSLDVPAPEFEQAWNTQLQRNGLRATRISGRN